VVQFHRVRPRDFRDLTRQPPAALILIIVGFVALLAFHVDAIPFWDARVYFDCVATAVHKPFDILNFRCAGHPSVMYLWAWGITQYLWPWKPAALYAVNMAVGAASIAAFDGIFRQLFPKASAVERVLAVSLYAFAPLFVVHAIVLNLDYAATALFVVFLYFLLAQRFWWAAVFAIATAFTKETGLAACALAVLAYLIAFVLRPGLSWAQRIAQIRSCLPLALVGAALVVYVLLVEVVRHEGRGIIGAYAPISAISASSREDAIWNTNLADPSIRAFLVDIFVLNFQWLYAVIIIIAIGVSIAAVGPQHSDDGRLSRRGMFLTLSLAGLVYVVTRYRFSNAARYVLLASPVLILAFYHSLQLVVRHRAIRTTYLAGCAVLVLASNFRTIDPVSRSVFGTIPFGRHALLDMSSFFGNLKLDCMVYNLEVLYLGYLYGDVAKDIRPEPGTTVLMGNAIFFFPPDIDGRTYALTTDPGHAVPLFVGLGDVKRDVLASHVRADGGLFYYVAFPNTDNTLLKPLLNEYPLVAVRKYDRKGYTLDLYTFRFLLHS